MKANRSTHLLLVTILVISLALLLGACTVVLQEPPPQASPIRDVSADICAWEALDWDELNATEQETWQVLGWDAVSWEAEDEADWPESDFKDWVDLSEAEREAAIKLGYNQELWDNFPCE